MRNHKTCVFTLLFLLISLRFFAFSVQEIINQELFVGLSHKEDKYILSLENITKRPIILSWEKLYFVNKYGEKIYSFSYKTDVLMPGDIIERPLPYIYDAAVFKIEYKIGVDEKEAEIVLKDKSVEEPLEKKDHEISEKKIEKPVEVEKTQEVEVFQDIPATPNYSYDSGWNQVSSLFIYNGWVEKDSSGRIVSIGGFNRGLGISFKHYFSPLEKSSWNSFWGWGITSVILPYYEIGTDYVYETGWYIGFKAGIPFVIGLNFGRFF